MEQATPLLPTFLTSSRNVAYCVKCLNRHKSGRMKIRSALTFIGSSFRHIFPHVAAQSNPKCMLRRNVRGYLVSVVFLKWIFCLSCFLTATLWLCTKFHRVIIPLSLPSYPFIPPSAYKPISLCDLQVYVPMHILTQTKLAF